MEAFLCTQTAYNDLKYETNTERQWRFIDEMVQYTARRFYKGADKS